MAGETEAESLEIPYGLRQTKEDVLYMGFHESEPVLSYKWP